MLQLRLCLNVVAALVVSLAASSTTTCPTNWYAFGSHCYGAFEGPLNWDRAKAACEALGASLASIHSQAENDHAIFACGNTRPFAQGCWIGGTDRNQRHRRWIWVDGTTWDWDKWFDHGGGNREPNNDFCSNHRHCTYGHTADCNVLEVSAKVPYKGFWLDTFCTDQQKYICKVNASASDAGITNLGAGDGSSLDSGVADGSDTVSVNPTTAPTKDVPPAAPLIRPVDRPAESGIRRLEAEADGGSSGTSAPAAQSGLAPTSPPLPPTPPVVPPPRLPQSSPRGANGAPDPQEMASPEKEETAAGAAPPVAPPAPRLPPRPPPAPRLEADAEQSESPQQAEPEFVDASPPEQVAESEQSSASTTVEEQVAESLEDELYQ